MSDLSALVPWIAGAFTCIASIFVGKWSSSGSMPATVFSSAFKALGLGIASIFLASAIHTTCIESLHICRSRGDGNISYALAPVLGIPLYWLIVLAASATTRRAAKPTVNPHHTAVNQALSEYRRIGRVTISCPSCGPHISITEERTSLGSLLLNVHCKCGQCNEQFSLRR